MKVRLKDIAERANISIAAVSRALSGKSDISLETRELVCRLAREMGYIPDANARSMRTGRSGTIGYLTNYLVTTLNSERTVDLIRELRRHDMKLLFSEFSDGALEWLLQNNIDALISGTLYIESSAVQVKNIAERYLGRDFPVITFGTVHIPGTDSVMLDYEDCGYKLASHMYDRGCRNLLVTCGGLHSYREVGIMRAASERGMPAPEILMDNEMSLKSAYLSVKQRLESSRNVPDGILIHNSHTSPAVLTALKELGISIPSDMAAASFENTETDAYMSIPLTSCGFRQADLTSALLKIIQYRMKHKTREKDIVLNISPVLEMRESSFPAPANS